MKLLDIVDKKYYCYWCKNELYHYFEVPWSRDAQFSVEDNFLKISSSSSNFKIDNDSGDVYIYDDMQGAFVPSRKGLRSLHALLYCTNHTVDNASTSPVYSREITFSRKIYSPSYEGSMMIDSDIETLIIDSMVLTIARNFKSFLRAFNDSRSLELPYIDLSKIEKDQLYTKLKTYITLS